MTNTKETPETQAPEKYRIDRASHSIYEYDADHRAYLFIGKYQNFGIKGRDSRAVMIRKIEAVEEEAFLRGER